MTRSGTPTETISAIGIQVDAIYPLREFMRRLGVGRHFVRSARAAGLRVRSYGNRSFVIAADFVEFLQRQAESGADA